jgi:hypothetical protein
MPEIEFIVLANHAEARDGLLYLMGGCWTDHWRDLPGEGPPPISHFGIGVAIMLQWDETNRPYHLILRLETDDGNEVAKMDADLTMGRPPELTPGSTQRAVLALNVDMQFPAPGGYRIMGELGEHRKSVAFRVHDRAGRSGPFPTRS